MSLPQPLEPVPRRSLSGAVFDQILDRIVAGVFPPGRPLPPERKLCVEIGVSRTAVREALARLAQLRLIQLRQGGETLVLDFREVAGLDLLPRLLRGDGGLQADVLGAGLEMRAALAPEIARLAAVRGGPAVAAELDEVLAAMAQAPGDPAALHVLSLRFWAPVVAGSENLAFRLAFNSLRDAFAAIRDEVAAAMARELGDHAGYRAIAAAIRRRDGAGAARATRAHLALGAPGLAAMVARLERRPS
jgi:GntR family transcriptional repressor for pyruvate dehydrogenase complex